MKYLKYCYKYVNFIYILIFNFKYCKLVVSGYFVNVEKENRIKILKKVNMYDWK